jgi:pimeloyl-ACP methyl ester carboxylesterase/protein-tyrosine phosphatase
MRTLVVYGGTVVLATASVYYLLRLASAKRDDTAAKGELAVHNICRLDGISLPSSFRSNHLPNPFSLFSIMKEFEQSADLYDPLDPSASEPGILRKHSSQKSYTAAGFVYPSIRTFYHPHPQADKLPTKPTSLPLLVFVHGLGGSAAQFAPLLTGLINAAPCLAIDLPGCGLSEFLPQTREAYTSEALAALIAEAITQHRDAENGQRVVLVGHSMGCSLSALLASSTSPVSHLISKYITGLIAICPRAETLTAKQVSRLQHMRYMPIPLFEVFRWWDRRGGAESASVCRYAGKDADSETKRLQLRFNEQSKSEVFMAMALGSMPKYEDDQAIGGLPGETVWSGLQIPTFCIGGAQDQVTPPENVELIAKWLGRQVPRDHTNTKDNSLPSSAGDIPIIDNTPIEENGKSFVPEFTAIGKDLVSETRQDSVTPDASKKPRFVLKTTVLPQPASHAMLYATSTVRILSGLIQSFVATHVDHRLSLGWQLQHLSTEGKWDVKNLAKWQAVKPVSEPIAGIFRAQKTLREIDEEHTPSVYVKRWGARSGIKHGVRMVVDISHESPVYDPKGLEEGGIEYHKFPTVSKLPPTVEEVAAFIALIDALREQLRKPEEPEGALIAVHCHYGFNRTGFFLVSYMVERLGWRLQDALEEFEEKRAPGIRHEHFVNELFVRYMVNLERRPTLS